MCIAIPFEVREINDNLAKVSIGTTSRVVYLDLLDEIKVGDFILVHAGFAIEKLDREEAEKTLSLFKEVADEIY